MSIMIRTRKSGPGYVGSIACVIRGRRLWSESAGIVRTTREDAKRDAQWLREQQERAGARALANIPDRNS